MPKMKRCAIFQLIVIVLQLARLTTVYALPFSIVPLGQLPTTVLIGGQVSAAYTVTNNTQSQRNGNIVKWLPPNTTVAASGCGSLFNLAPGARCILNLNITGPVNANIADPKQHLFVCFTGGKTCAGTPDPLNVALSTRQQYAYIANETGNTVSICKTRADNTLSNCIAQTDPSFTQPADVILNSNATFAYVANNGSGKISICRVNANNGSLNNCQLSGLVYTPEGYPGLQIINKYLYASDYWANTVVSCPIRANGTLGDCLQNTGDGTFSSPNGRVAFNRTGALAYVPNYWSTDDVSICHVNSNGGLSKCVAHIDPAIFKPLGTYMNPRGDYLYIANGGNNNHMVICPVNANGSLGRCTSVSDPSFALGDYQLNMFVSSNQYIYIPNPGGGLSGLTLSICPIQPDGLLGVCTINTGSDTFNGLTSAWITFDS